MIILDTDCLSLLERGGSESIRLQEKLAEFSPDEIVTTIISFEEQMRGWMAFLSRAKTTDSIVHAYEKLTRFLDTFRIIPTVEFDDAAGKVFDHLRSLKLRVGTMDLKIASIAISRNAILISRNLSDFEIIPNLTVEDWTRNSPSN